MLYTGLSGSEPSLKHPSDRVKSAPMTGRAAASSRLQTSAHHRPNIGLLSSHLYHDSYAVNPLGAQHRTLGIVED